VLEAPRLGSSPETGGCGLLGCSVFVCDEDRLVRPFLDRAVEVAGGVAVAGDDASGVELGADPADRSVVNVGSVPAVPAEPSGLGQAHRPLLPSGRGGGPVVVRAGESPVHGEGVQ
jgi:hypothetical protein